MNDSVGNVLTLGDRVEILSDEPQSSFFMQGDIMQITNLIDNNNQIHGYLVGGTSFGGIADREYTNYVSPYDCILSAYKALHKKKLRSWVIQ